MVKGTDTTPADIRKADSILNPGQERHLTKGQVEHLISCDTCEEKHDMALQKRAMEGLSERIKAQQAEAMKKQGLRTISNKELAKRAPKGEVIFGGEPDD